MNGINSPVHIWKKITIVVAAASLALNCHEDLEPEAIITPCEFYLSSDSNFNTNKPCMPIDCQKCKYIIRDDEYLIDGKALGIEPGDFVCFAAGNRNRASPLVFTNINGSPGNPVYIVNCGGKATIRVNDGSPFNLKFAKSSNFRVTGSGGDEVYGFELAGATLGLTLDYLSTDFEVDHVEVSKAGFAGIMAKTDPTCDSATWRGNFEMKNISIHDNFIHHVGGEGFYIGNSFYSDGVLDSCGQILPHVLRNVKVFNNQTQHTGREGVQVGCAIEGAEIFNNKVESYGELNLDGQDNGIQVGDGTSGLCYNNFVVGGKGSGIIVLGLGNNIVFNNVIAKTGGYGIFCNDRNAFNRFNIINNTIVDTKDDGIRFYASGRQANTIINNLIVNPGSVHNPDYLDTLAAFLFLYDTLNSVVQKKNLFMTKIGMVKFRDPDKYDFDLGYRSPAAQVGMDVSSFGVNFDYLGRKRPVRILYDIGAFESVSRR